ncbi:uncharacterized protein DNG_09563 [Cephalotrichum gorgonifer]|uniref:PLAC8 domain-containing protein n=1 Tax=Cephalotrichum gorgonifer TaxID=2041049 RepID=A0AAE8SZG5_9PEZI|nr:uncharacterized protein DNG_09563 [Cephalotrichum gorgonifer]
MATFINSTPGEPPYIPESADSQYNVYHPPQPEPARRCMFASTFRPAQPKVASGAGPQQPSRQCRHTGSPSTLAGMACGCPWVIYGRIEYRIRDLEKGGDGFGGPASNCNLRCCCGAFQFCCCCFCCFGYPEILVLQRDIARIWGYPGPERDEDAANAKYHPCRFLAETEEGLYKACVSRRANAVTRPYTAEPPMSAAPGIRLPPPARARGRAAAGPSLIIPPEPSPNGSYAQPAPLFQPPPMDPPMDRPGMTHPRPMGPSMGPSMGHPGIMTQPFPMHYNVDEYEPPVERTAYSRRVSPGIVSRGERRRSRPGVAEVAVDHTTGSSRQRMPGSGAGSPTATVIRRQGDPCWEDSGTARGASGQRGSSTRRGEHFKGINVDGPIDLSRGPSWDCTPADHEDHEQEGHASNSSGEFCTASGGSGSGSVSSERYPSRIIIEGSETDVVEESYGWDGGGSGMESGRSVRSRSVRLRVDISRGED